MKKLRFSFNYAEYSFFVSGSYVPEEKEVLYDKNGDPGHPGSSSEFDLEHIEIIEGDLLSLIVEVQESIINVKDSKSDFYIKMLEAADREFFNE